jgi:hypothetical protein
VFRVREYPVCIALRQQITAQEVRDRFGVDPVFLFLRAIGASKKKDRIDSEKIADLLRCDLLPECYMAPSWIRELRRMLRYRNLLVRKRCG